MTQNNENTAERTADDFGADLRRAIEVVRAGGVILYPTDTVWGIGCDATNVEAVRRVYEIKHRADSKALIVLVGDIGQLERTVDGIPDVAYDLIEYSERPLTIIYDRAVGVASNLSAEDGTLAVRVTSEAFSRALCRELRRPLVSTSANISGQPTPAIFADIDPAIVDSVDYVCTTRRDDTTRRPASTIMRLGEDGSFKIIRP